MRKLVLTVGNEMMGDDGAGPRLAELLKRSPLQDWVVLDGGQAPENYLHQVREFSPDVVWVVDAADMDLEPGSIRRIHADQIQDTFIMTTHSLPLCYLLESLGEFVQEVELIGIQPETVAFGYPLSARVAQAVEFVYQGMALNCNAWDSLEI